MSTCRCHWHHGNHQRSPLITCQSIGSASGNQGKRMPCNASKQPEMGAGSVSGNSRGLSCPRTDSTRLKALLFLIQHGLVLLCDAPSRWQAAAFRAWLQEGSSVSPLRAHPLPLAPGLVVRGVPVRSVAAGVPFSKSGATSRPRLLYRVALSQSVERGLVDTRQITLLLDKGVPVTLLRAVK